MTKGLIEKLIEGTLLTTRNDPSKTGPSKEKDGAEILFTLLARSGQDTLSHDGGLGEVFKRASRSSAHPTLAQQAFTIIKGKSEKTRVYIQSIEKLNELADRLNPETPHPEDSQDGVKEKDKKHSKTVLLWAIIFNFVNQQIHFKNLTTEELEIAASVTDKLDGVFKSGLIKNDVLAEMVTNAKAVFKMKKTSLTSADLAPSEAHTLPPVHTPPPSPAAQPAHTNEAATQFAEFAGAGISVASAAAQPAASSKEEEEEEEEKHDQDVVDIGDKGKKQESIPLQALPPQGSMEPARSVETAKKTQSQQLVILLYKTLVENAPVFEHTTKYKMFGSGIPVKNPENPKEKIRVQDGIGNMLEVFYDFNFTKHKNSGVTRKNIEDVSAEEAHIMMTQMIHISLLRRLAHNSDQPFGRDNLPGRIYIAFSKLSLAAEFTEIADPKDKNKKKIIFDRNATKAKLPTDGSLPNIKLDLSDEKLSKAPDKRADRRQKLDASIKRTMGELTELQKIANERMQVLQAPKSEPRYHHTRQP